MKIIPFLLFILLLGCQKKNTGNVITITGFVKNIPAKKVYLTNAYNWQFFLDSANYKNDTFSFNINPNNFEPYLASIYYVDSNRKLHSLPFQNYILSTREKNYGNTGFMLDKGNTSISGILNDHPTIKTEKLKISGSKQNDPLFKTQLIDFGWISTSNKEARAKIIDSYKSLISQYPYSYYFLSTLYSYRTLYTKKELIDILDLFNNDTELSNYKQRFLTYFKEMPSPGKPLNNFTLKNSFNEQKKIIDDSSQLNIIIFWASWCGPCRREIPKLKKIYNEFKNKSIHMVSISMDTNKEMWREALLKEDMQWEQLIVDSLLSINIKNSFNIYSIPLIIFSDNKGIEQARFSGYEVSDKDDYTPIIKKNLKSFHN